MLLDESNPDVRNALDVKPIPQWELKTVSDRPWKQDNSGVYVLIYWRQKECDCRLDVMTTQDEPVVSFAGSTEAVRKAFCDWASDICLRVSLEHASYIGRELTRARNLMEAYIQD